MFLKKNVIVLILADSNDVHVSYWSLTQTQAWRWETRLWLGSELYNVYANTAATMSTLAILKETTHVASSSHWAKLPTPETQSHLFHPLQCAYVSFKLFTPCAGVAVGRLLFSPLSVWVCVQNNSTIAHGQIFPKFSGLHGRIFPDD